MCGIQTRWKQIFYEDVPPIELRDPLAEFLGAIEEGEPLIFTYGDAVKLAGHSCPSVAGAYQIVRKALGALYGKEALVRGQIRVRVLGKPEHGANGPMAQVIMLITGAAGNTGFGGLGDKFVRRDLLAFDEAEEEPNAFVFTRTDTGRSVKVTYHPERLPQSPEMSKLFVKCISGTANGKQKAAFEDLWQARVKAVLFEEVDGLFAVGAVRQGRKADE
jgi:hypothetical protein